MNTEELRNRLQTALEKDDLDGGTRKLAEHLKTSGAGLEAVVEILHFMEAHPDADFGAPGSLVHFVEKFYKQGYESALVESVNRRPTSHTVWMLHRVINGTSDANERTRLIGILRSASEHPSANKETKESALDFMEGLLDLPAPQ
jgi:hypothetical protein